MKPPVISGILVFLLAVFTCCGGNAVNRGIFAPSRLDHIKGQDGVSSIPFDENTTLWTFADTIIPINEKDKSAPDGYTMISNSLAWTEKITPSNVSSVKFSYYTENGRVSQFIKNSRRENPLHHRLWALDGLRIGNRVYVYYAHIFVPDHTKFLEFTVKYIGLAVWDVPHNWSPGAGFDFRRTGILFPEGSPFFGAAAMIRACFDEDDEEQRAGACHDQYTFVTRISLDEGVSEGAPRIMLETAAGSYPGRVTRQADSLEQAPLTQADLVWAQDATCSYRRTYTRSADGLYAPDQPLPPCTDYLEP